MGARWLLALCLWMSPLAAPAAPVEATINVAGAARHYMIDAPALRGPKPTIIFLHGLGAGAIAAMQATQLPLVGEQQGFVSVFPAALAHRWNVFPDGGAPASYLQDWQQAGAGTPDDVGFIRALVHELVARGVADPRRVYIAGFSAGGFMSMWLVCKNAELFAGVALISSSMPQPAGANCHPSAPTPLYALKGTADQNEPYNGGTVLDGSFSVWSAQQLTDFFRQLDGCGDHSTPVSVAGANAARESFRQWSCTNGPVILGTVQNGAHALYPAPPPAQTLWWFFAPLRR
jgi:polyhydroxybutyrate depolymerase